EVQACWLKLGLLGRGGQLEDGPARAQRVRRPRRPVAARGLLLRIWLLWGRLGHRGLRQPKRVIAPHRTRTRRRLPLRDRRLGQAERVIAPDRAPRRGRPWPGLRRGPDLRGLGQAEGIIA